MGGCHPTLAHELVDPNCFFFFNSQEGNVALEYEKKEKHVKVRCNSFLLKKIKKKTCKRNKKVVFYERH